MTLACSPENAPKNMGCQTPTAKAIYHQYAEMRVLSLSKPCIQGFWGEGEGKVGFEIGKVG